MGESGKGGGKGKGGKKCRFILHRLVTRSTHVAAMVLSDQVLALQARDMAGKILVLHFPLTVYTVAGFEHSITNLVVVPLGNRVEASIPPPPRSPVSCISQTLSRSGTHLTDGGSRVVAGIMYGADVQVDKWVYNNLIPAAIGNFIGGGLIVGGFVTLIYSWDESGHGNLNVPMPIP